MIGEFLAYAANRATSGAVESVSRLALWYGAGVSILLCGLFFVVLAAFWTLEPSYGPIQAAGIIAGTCIFLSLLCFVVPGIVSYVHKQRAIEKAKAASADPVAETIETVKSETADAVDYFGPIKVMLTAFMFGIGAAKQMRRTIT